MHRLLMAECCAVPAQRCPTNTPHGQCCNAKLSILLSGCVAEHAAQPAQPPRDGAGADAPVQQRKRGKKKRRKLWVDKYSPRSYLHLLSEEGINRETAQWLMTWRRCVEAADESSREPSHHGAMAVTAPHRRRKAAPPPEQKLLLLCGPPGACRSLVED